jgi:8-oxo-dGTP pyrophosphatase MutT (NUDIX family)
VGKGKHHHHIQFAALPVRHDEGGCRIMLLTSRETHRWVIPKRWPMHGRKPAEVAAREAFEEAGLLGKIVGEHPVGTYHYTKQLSPDRDVLCEVRVFLFLVERQLDDWPERGKRQTRWFDASDAYELVDEGGLAEIMRRAVGSPDDPR